MYGPTKMIVYGKKILEKMPPYMGGGEMIKDVNFKKQLITNYLINSKREHQILEMLLDSMRP